MTTIEVHQNLMDEFYEYWRKSNEDRELALSKHSSLHQAAVRLGNLNYQVGNGGFSQWELNGYSVDVEELLEICDKGVSLGLESFEKLKKIVTKYSKIPEPTEDTEEVECSECDGKGSHYQGEDEEQCDNCYGTGEVSEEIGNQGEIDLIYEELDKDYYALTAIESEMNTLLLRWKEVDSIEVEVYDVYADGTFKPDCDFKGIDGNVFVVIGHVSKTLKRAGLREKAKQFEKEATEQKSYEQVIGMLSDYVNIRI